MVCTLCRRTNNSLAHGLLLHAYAHHAAHSGEWQPRPGATSGIRFALFVTGAARCRRRPVQSLWQVLPQATSGTQVDGDVD